MDIRRFSLDVKDVVKEAGLLVLGNKSSRLCKYDRVILFARIWFLKVEIYISCSSTPFTSFVKHFTKELHESSCFLRSSGTEGGILKLLRRTAEFLGQSDELGRKVFRGLIYKFLVQIRLMKAEVLLLELMEDEIRLGLPLKIQIGTLREGIIFLTESDVNQEFENSVVEKMFLEDFERLAGEIQSLCNSYPAINDMEAKLPNLLSKVQRLKFELKKLYFDQIPTLSSPKTIGLGCIEAVLQKLEELHRFGLESHDSLACATYQIKAVRDDLESIVPWYSNSLLVDDDHEHIENQEEMGEISLRIVDAVYQVEHVIDSILLGRDSLWKLLLWLYHLSEVILKLKSEIQDCDSGNQARTQMVDDLFTEARYRYLPNDLMQCFLYFGAFPKDEDISVRTLLWLWIAERFIPQSSSECLEDVAEQYLMNLISRGLVRAVKRGRNGKVKTCRVDGPVLDLCLSEAENAKFLELVTGKTYSGSSNAPGVVNYEHYRLSIHGDPRQFIASKPSGSSVRSLLFFVSNVMYPGCHNDVSFIIDKLKLVKVLNMESLNIGNTLENGVGLLICLRYMAIGGDIDSLPPSLSKLKDLETLVVKGLKNSFVLPHTIWSMTRLRHIRVTDCIFTMQLQDDKKESHLFKLDGLESLSMPSFPCGKETNDILAKLPNLRKLKCILLQPRLGEREQFPEFGFLRHLESLKICYYGRLLNDVEWSLPWHLKELTLSNFRLPWDQISALSVLPNLEVLKLVSKAFEGTTWDMDEGRFERLRYLKLDSLDIIHWYADGGQLPNLEQLVLQNCKQLQEVPSSFKFIVTLQPIEVYHCGISVEESVQRMVEDCKNGCDTDTLVSCSMPSFSCMEETNDILTRLPDLCKLKCTLLPPRLGKVCQFPELGSIHDVESLELLYPRKPLNNVALWNLPSSLKDLTLSNFRLPWDQISAISKLPNLEVLKLLSEAFEGTTWEMEQGKFEKLRYLKLVSLNLVHWYADEDCLPNLEQLVLRYCKQLKTAPSGFGLIPILERIQVHQCGSFVENWAREIVEVQLEYSNFDLVSNFS